MSVPPFLEVRMMSPYESSTHEGGSRSPKTALINSGNRLTTKIIYDARRTVGRKTPPL